MVLKIESVETFEFDHCVRGFHVYKVTWTSFNDEELLCHKEDGNLNDSYAVAVMKLGSLVVVSKKLSTVHAICLQV